MQYGITTEQAKLKDAPARDDAQKTLQRDGTSSAKRPFYEKQFMMMHGTDTLFIHTLEMRMLHLWAWSISNTSRHTRSAR